MRSARGLHQHKTLFLKHLEICFIRIFPQQLTFFHHAYKEFARQKALKLPTNLVAKDFLALAGSSASDGGRVVSIERIVPSLDTLDLASPPENHCIRQCRSEEGGGTLSH